MNVLKMAQRVIKKQNFTYNKFVSRTKNDIGQYVPTFMSYPISGNIQPVNQNIYQQMGLDFQKTYVIFHVSEVDIGDVNRDTSGDEIIYNEHIYQGLSKLQDWYTQRGFMTLLGIQID